MYNLADFVTCKSYKKCARLKTSYSLMHLQLNLLLTDHYVTKISHQMYSLVQKKLIIFSTYPANTLMLSPFLKTTARFHLIKVTIYKLLMNSLQLETQPKLRSIGLIFKEKINKKCYTIFKPNVNKPWIYGGIKISRNYPIFRKDERNRFEHFLIHYE